VTHVTSRGPSFNSIPIVLSDLKSLFCISIRTNVANPVSVPPTLRPPLPVMLPAHPTSGCQAPPNPYNLSCCQPPTCRCQAVSPTGQPTPTTCQVVSLSQPPLPVRLSAPSSPNDMSCCQPYPTLTTFQTVCPSQLPQTFRLSVPPNPTAINCFYLDA
jgi:hypothetical protein